MSCVCLGILEILAPSARQEDKDFGVVLVNVRALYIVRIATIGTSAKDGRSAHPGLHANQRISLENVIDRAVNYQGNSVLGQCVMFDHHLMNLASANFETNVQFIPGFLRFVDPMFFIVDRHLDFP
jgi:hypothetical protein